MSVIKERDRREAKGSEFIGLCNHHNEEISLVCLEECQPICVWCHTNGEHKNHECRQSKRSSWNLRTAYGSIRDSAQEADDLLQS
uniref:B box-type domain-containing protein n=1 Tax=Anguilla anguilla TaxID=7936 RepID=A0A0E9RUV2_ANGAN